jgi:hypothetical protein
MADVERKREEFELFATPSEGDSTTYNEMGVGYLRTEGGWFVLILALVEMKVSSEAHWKLGLAAPSAEPDLGGVFKQGIAAHAKFNTNLHRLANEFCEDYLRKLYDNGFRIVCRQAGQQASSDGTVMGPGPVVFFIRAAGGEEEFDAHHKKAIAFGNDMKFCREGVEVSIKELECAVGSGGPLYDLTVKDPGGHQNRVFLELVGLGREYGAIHTEQFMQMCAKVSVIWKKHIFPNLSADEEEFKRESEELMKELMSGLQATRIENDGEIWEIMQEEISGPCPSFGRLSKAQRWRIFHRIKVRLGLAEDE